MKKTYDLPESSIEIIHETMKEKGFKTEVDTVIYLIEKTKDENILINKMKEEFKNDIVRFRLGLRTAEHNSIVIKDAINSMLYFYELEKLIPACGEKTHFVIAQSEENLKKLIEQRKQEKDDRNSKLNEVE